jgi:hypothetical protein
VGSGGLSDVLPLTNFAVIALAVIEEQRGAFNARGCDGDPQIVAAAGAGVEAGALVAGADPGPAGPRGGRGGLAEAGGWARGPGRTRASGRAGPGQGPPAVGRTSRRGPGAGLQEGRADRG